MEVNRGTGEVRVLRLLGAQDSGRLINVLTYENQVFGGMTMGVGFGLTEERMMDAQTGQVLTQPTCTTTSSRRRWTCRPTDVPADRPPRHRVQHRRLEGPRRAGDDPDGARRSRTRSSTRPVCGSRTRR